MMKPLCIVIYLAFYTSESIENQWVSTRVPNRTSSMIRVIIIESRMVISRISTQCSMFTRYIHRLNCMKRSTLSLILDFVIRVWITSSNQCRLFLQYEIHLDDSLIPDEQVI